MNEGNIICLLPPLVMEDNQLKAVLTVLAEVIQEAESVLPLKKVNIGGDRYVNPEQC